MKLSKLSETYILGDHIECYWTDQRINVVMLSYASCQTLPWSDCKLCERAQELRGRHNGRRSVVKVGGRRSSKGGILFTVVDPCLANGHRTAILSLPSVLCKLTTVMRLSFDIWREIIACLKYPDDEPTLRSLAVASKLTSGLALDAIWRDGTRFRRIVSVINSFSASLDEPFLKLEYIYHSESDPEESDDSDDSAKDWRDPVIKPTEITWVSCIYNARRERD